MGGQGGVGRGVRGVESEGRGVEGSRGMVVREGSGVRGVREGTAEGVKLYVRPSRPSRCVRSRIPIHARCF